MRNEHLSFTGLVPNQNKSGAGKIILGIVLMLPLMGLLGYRIYKNVTFDRNCSGHLKRAADANTVKLAEQELEIALSYLETNKITTGYTSVIYQTPDEDIDFWYKNLKASSDELKTISPNASPLEKSNVLIKLCETLLDDEGEQTSVTMPSGISVYPNNKRLVILMFMMICAALIGAAFMASESPTLTELLVIISLIAILVICIL